MKNIMFMLCVLCQTVAVFAADKKFKESLRSYDPVKDVGLKDGTCASRGYQSPRRVEIKRPVSQRVSRYTAEICNEADNRLPTPLIIRRNAIDRRRVLIQYAQHRYNVSQTPERAWQTPRLTPREIQDKSKQTSAFLQKFADIERLRTIATNPPYDLTLKNLERIVGK